MCRKLKLIKHVYKTAMIDLSSLIFKMRIIMHPPHRVAVKMNKMSSDDRAGTTHQAVYQMSYLILSTSSEVEPIIFSPVY